jgi:hypothetical protein
MQTPTWARLMAEPLRLEAEGTVYRVFDTTMRAGQLIAANPPAAWATSRVFRPKLGHRRLYRLRAPEDRQTDEATLRRQLAASEYLPTMPVGGSDQDPR